MIAEKAADDALMEKISKGGVLDATNPAEVAAAMRVIKNMTGADARLTVEEMAKLKEKQGGVTAAEVIGADQNVQNEVANEKMRSTTAEAQRLADVEIGQAIITPLQSNDILRDIELQEQFEKDPSAMLSRERKLLITLDDQYDKKLEIYEVVNREGNMVTLSRVDRTGPDGKELPDPMDWKVLLKEVSVEEILAKKARLAG